MRLADGIFLVGSGNLGVSMTHALDCNAYALRCGDEYVLIDSGAGMETERILDVLRVDGIPADRVRHLLLTHYHLDHSGGAAALREALGLDVWAGSITASALEAGDEEAISLAAAKRAGVYPPSVKFAACPVARVLQPGETIAIGDTTILPIAAPGHSRDMLCFLVRQPGRTLLFSGDVIFYGGRIVLQDVPDCDVPAYFSTLRILADLDFDMMFPGHGLWSLADGRRHVRDAMSFVNRLLLPPNL
jgi:glyoxylase-like metal-dependent hydrolase (beta-lactamase superfamily II)